MHSWKLLRIEKIVLAFFAVYFVAWASVYIWQSSIISVDGKRYFCLVDDAMISMRYGWNLAHGKGLTWNPGEYVEGYTNLLMTLLMSVGSLALTKSAAVLFVQICGVVAVLVSAYLAMCIARRCTIQEYQTVVGLLVYVGTLAYYPLVYFSLMGMETGLLTVLLLSCIITSIRYAESPTLRKALGLAVCSGLAFLTRPDSLLLCALPFAYALVVRREWSRMGLAGVLYATFPVGQGAFRYFYYGTLAPNTYTLKLSGFALSDRVAGGIGFVLPFLKEHAVLIALAALAFVLTAGVFKRKSLEFMLLAAMSVTAIAYQVYVGGDPWNYWRIMAPIMPLVLILSVHGMIWLSRLIYYSDSKLTAVVTILFMLPILLFTTKRFLPEITLLDRPFQWGSNASNLHQAIILKNITTPDATLGVLWAGTIPYYSDRYSVDFLGKCDRHIACLSPDLSGKISWLGMKSVPGHNKYDLAYSIKTLLPTYSQTLSWGGQDITEWANDRYEKVVIMAGPNYPITIYLRKGAKEVMWSQIKKGT